MGWDLTNDLEKYVRVTTPFLRSDRAGNTVLLSVLETLKLHGANAYGENALFGWWRNGRGDVDGAFLQTPPRPMLLSAMPVRAARQLADAVPVHGITGVNADNEVAEAFANAWQLRTGIGNRLQMRQRQYRLEHLEETQPLPPGASRLASEHDLPLIYRWFEAFRDEAAASGPVNAALVRSKVADRGIVLWEVDGTAVALVGRTRVIAGMTRISPVYTPPEHRRRGYGTAATAAMTRSALESADVVVLFTDLANPTSNSIYQHIGYRPVKDKVVLSFL